MFDAGLSEFILLFIIGLLILGPERLPRVASQIGRWVGRARRTASQLRYQLEREIALNDIRKPPRKPSTPPQPGRADAPASEAARGNGSAANSGTADAASDASAGTAGAPTDAGVGAGTSDPASPDSTSPGTGAPASSDADTTKTGP